jgi:hypothetical protein
LDENTNNFSHIISTLLESLRNDLQPDIFTTNNSLTIQTVCKQEKTLMILLNYRLKVTTPSEYIKELLLWICADYNSVKEIIERAEELAYLSMI